MVIVPKSDCKNLREIMVTSAIMHAERSMYVRWLFITESYGVKQIYCQLNNGIGFLV